jgi:hypothetical protein
MVTTVHPATAQRSTFNPLTTWDGWQQFVDTPPAPALDVGDQEWTLEQREDYHARFVVLKTPAMDAISTAVRRLLLLNRGQQGGARRGLIISGPATTGKPTAMQQLGRTVELADRRCHPNRDGRLPVLFITVPPSSTPKMLISEFARFLGLPTLERMNQIQITNAVCELLCEMGTQLVLVDDVHLMDTRSRAGAETSDQLKYLGERIPATFVYSGIDVETSPLLTGVRGSQLAGRFKIVRNQPLRYGSPADKQIWHDLCTAWTEPCGCAATGPAPCSRTPPTCTPAPAAGWAASPTSSAKPLSYRCWTAPRRSLRDCSNRSSSTPQPNSGPGHHSATGRPRNASPDPRRLPQPSVPILRLATARMPVHPNLPGTISAP